MIAKGRLTERVQRSIGKKREEGMQQAIGRGAYYPDVMQHPMRKESKTKAMRPTIDQGATRCHVLANRSPPKTTSAFDSFFFTSQIGRVKRSM